MIGDDYRNGFLQRETGGAYEGRLTIDGVNISPIEGQYFKRDGELWLWLRRKPIMEYDIDTQTFRKRSRSPFWEVYLQRKIENGETAFKGEFIFLKFRYSITGLWDKVIGKEKRRLNLFVERLPLSQQSLINKINDKKRKETNGEVG